MFSRKTRYDKTWAAPSVEGVCPSVESRIPGIALWLDVGRTVLPGCAGPSARRSRPETRRPDRSPLPPPSARAHRADSVRSR